ncbi:hypothetical protein ACIQM3_20600 [Streptomyces sp. NPDC091271]|uniref:hypothetical protein n=1 Tax=Streptomyces sp. NPDC091271 TaxID=3365980 RepID=UPI00382D1606
MRLFMRVVPSSDAASRICNDSLSSRKVSAIERMVNEQGSAPGRWLPATDPGRHSDRYSCLRALPVSLGTAAAGYLAAVSADGLLLGTVGALAPAVVLGA